MIKFVSVDKKLPKEGQFIIGVHYGPNYTYNEEQNIPKLAYATYYKDKGFMGYSEATGFIGNDKSMDIKYWAADTEFPLKDTND